MIGIDPLRENRATRFDAKITTGRALADTAAHEVVIGAGLGVRLKAATGDELVIVSQAADGSIANDLYTIVGVAASGDQVTDQIAIYLHLADAQELFVMPGSVHEIAVVVDELSAVDETADKIRTALAGENYDVATWKVFAHSFYMAMKADKQGTWVSLLIIGLVVAVGVLNTVLMTVLERRREYGVLRAIGTGPGQIFRLVVIEVLVMAFMAILLGCGTAYVINYWLSFEGVPMPDAISYGGIVFDRMYTVINVRSFLLPGVLVFVTAALVSVFPALRAAHIAPAKAMRIH